MKINIFLLCILVVFSYLNFFENIHGFVVVEVTGSNNGTNDDESKFVYGNGSNGNGRNTNHTIIQCNTSFIIGNKLYYILNSQFFKKTRVHNISEERTDFLPQINNSSRIISNATKAKFIANTVADTVNKADSSGSVRVNVTLLQERILNIFSGLGIAEGQVLAKVVRDTITESHVDVDGGSFVRALAEHIGEELADIILRVTSNDTFQTSVNDEFDVDQKISIQFEFLRKLKDQISSGEQPDKEDLKTFIVNIILSKRPNISEEVLDNIIGFTLDDHDLKHLKVFSLLDDVFTAIHHIIPYSVFCKGSDEGQTGIDDGSPRPEASSSIGSEVVTSGGLSGANISTASRQPRDEISSSAKKPISMADITFISYDITMPNVTDRRVLDYYERSVGALIAEEVEVNGTENLDISSLTEKVKNLASIAKHEIRISIYDYSKPFPFIVNVHYEESATPESGKELKKQGVDGPNVNAGVDAEAQ